MIIYHLKYNNLHFFFYLTHFRKLGQKYKYIFVQFLVQMKTSKFAFEINWPLLQNRVQRSIFIPKCLNTFWTDQTSVFAFKFEIQENCNHWSFTNFPSYPTLLIKQTYNIMIMRHVNENWKWSSRNFMRKQKRLKLLIQVLLWSLLRDGGQR